MERKLTAILYADVAGYSRLTGADEEGTHRTLNTYLDVITASIFEGDFMTLDERIDNADICLLDKVVCCYPDAQGLVQKSLAKTKQVYGLTYPRDRSAFRSQTGHPTAAIG